MKIVFTELPTSCGKIQVSFDGGSTFKDYNVTEIKVSGIPLDDNQDYEKIRIKGSSNVLKNLDVISKRLTTLQKLTVVIQILQMLWLMNI